MASDVRFWVVRPGADAEAAVERARAIGRDGGAHLHTVRPDERPHACQRRGPRVAAGGARVLRGARARRAGAPAHRGPVRPARAAVLRSMGYDRSLPFAERSLMLDGARPRPPAVAGRARRAWKPGVRRGALAVRVGNEPVDLGGIGKGLAVTWAARAPRRLRATRCWPRPAATSWRPGGGPDGDGWMVDVENPFGGQAAAVLRVTDRGIATSSTRIRSWTVGERQVHHLIDPRTAAARGVRPRVGHRRGRRPRHRRGVEQVALRPRSLRHPVVRRRPRTRRTLDRHRRPRRCQSRDASLRRLAGIPCLVNASTPSTVRPISTLVHHDGHRPRPARHGERRRHELARRHRGDARRRRQDGAVDPRPVRRHHVVPPARRRSCSSASCSRTRPAPASRGRARPRASART